MENNKINLNEVFDDALPFSVQHYDKVFLNTNYFLASFCSFLRKTKDYDYVKNNFNNLKQWFFEKINEKINGSKDVEIQFYNDNTYLEYKKVEDFTINDFNNFIVTLNKKSLL